MRVKENPVNCPANGVCKEYRRETDGGNETASSLKVKAAIDIMLTEVWFANLLKLIRFFETHRRIPS